MDEVESNLSPRNEEDNSIKKPLFRKQLTAKTLHMVKNSGEYRVVDEENIKRDPLNDIVEDPETGSPMIGPNGAGEAIRRQKKILTTGNMLRTDRSGSIRKLNDEGTVQYDPAKIKKIIEAKYRTPHQTKLLLTHLIETNSYFRSLVEGEDALEQEALLFLCKNIQYQKLAPGKVIFKEGDDPNDKVYIVYSGELFVIVKKRDVISEMNLKKKEQEVDSDSDSSGEETSDNTPHSKSFKKKKTMGKSEDLKGAKKSQFGQALSHEEGSITSINNKHSFAQIGKTVGVFMTLQKVTHEAHNTVKQNSTVVKPLQLQKAVTNLAPATPEKVTPQNAQLKLQKSITGIGIGRNSTITPLQKKTSLLERRQFENGDSLKVQTTPSNHITIPESPDDSDEEKGSGSNMKLKKKSTFGSSKKETADTAAIVFAKKESDGLRQSRARKSSMWKPPDSVSGSPAKGGRFDFETPECKRKDSIDSSIHSPSTLVEPDPEELQKKINRRIARNGAIKDIIFKGGIFGEMAIGSKRKRGATIMTKSETELLTINGDDYMLIKQKYDVKKKKVIDFMLHHIPELENVQAKQVIESLTYLMDEKKFDYGNYVAKEATFGEEFYLVYEGTVELTKTLQIKETLAPNSVDLGVASHLRMRPSYKEEVIISTVGSGGFVGEEILINKDQKFYYNIKVTSGTAILFKLDRAKFLFRFPRCSFLALRDSFFNKQAERSDLLRQKISFKYKSMEMIEDRPIRRRVFQTEVEGRAAYGEEVIMEDEILRYPIQLKATGKNSINMRLKLRSLGNIPKQNSKTALNSVENSPRKAIKAIKTVSGASTGDTNISYDPLEFTTQKTLFSSPKEVRDYFHTDTTPNKSQTIRIEDYGFSSFLGRNSIGKMIPDEIKMTPMKADKSSAHLNRKSADKTELKLLMKTSHNYVPMSRNEKPKTHLRTSVGSHNYLENLENTLQRMEENKDEDNDLNKKIEGMKLNVTVLDKAAERRYAIQKKYISKKYGTYEDPNPDYLKSLNNGLENLMKKTASVMRLPQIEESFLDLVTTRSNRGTATSRITQRDFDFDRLILGPGDIKEVLAKQNHKLKGLKIVDNPIVPEYFKNINITATNRHSKHPSLDLHKIPELKSHDEVMKWKISRLKQLRGTRSSKCVTTTEGDDSLSLQSTIDNMMKTRTAQFLVSKLSESQTSIVINTEM